MKNNKINLETANKTFNEIIANGKNYQVPRYQRDYSWNQEQWEDLWEDVNAIYQEDKNQREEHYMGYLVLQKQNINTFKIIDGQQRLTTISLIILAALQTIQRSDNQQDKKRLDLIRNHYISAENISTLAIDYKLELNRNNNEYYRSELASLSESPRKRSIKQTEHLMRKAKEFYEDKINKLTLNSTQLADFIDNVLAHYLIFTVITVGDDVNAYKVFETLNARGVQLSTPDLLKNHLFSLIDPKGEYGKLIEQQEEKWSLILSSLGTEDFSKFLRCYWNSQQPLVTKTNLFRSIKKQYQSKEHAINLLDDLKKRSSIYAALRREDDELCKDISDITDKQKVRNCLAALRTFNIVQPYPVLLSGYFAHYKQNQPSFAKLCHWIEVFCIRYQAICNLPATDVEKFYNRLAIKIHSNVSIEQVKEDLQSKLPGDDEFKSHFQNKTFSITQSAKKVRYLLIRIENQLSPQNPISISDHKYSVEHILPRNEAGNEDYWRKQFGDLLEQAVSRLGNLSLLSAADNKAADQHTFEAKKNIYRKSILGIVQKLLEYKDWNINNLNMYQEFLSQQAVAIWKLN